MLQVQLEEKANTRDKGILTEEEWKSDYDRSKASKKQQTDICKAIPMMFAAWTAVCDQWPIPRMTCPSLNADKKTTPHNVPWQSDNRQVSWFHLGGHIMTYFGSRSSDGLMYCPNYLVTWTFWEAMNESRLSRYDRIWIQNMKQESRREEEITTENTTE